MSILLNNFSIFGPIPVTKLIGEIINYLNKKVAYTKIILIDIYIL